MQMYRIFYSHTNSKKKKKSTSLVYFKSTIFEINLQDTCARGDKYSSKLDIFRSLIRIFVLSRRY